MSGNKARPEISELRGRPPGIKAEDTSASSERPLLRSVQSGMGPRLVNSSHPRAEGGSASTPANGQQADAVNRAVQSVGPLPGMSASARPPLRSASDKNTASVPTIDLGATAVHDGSAPVAVTSDRRAVDRALLSDSSDAGDSSFLADNSAAERGDDLPSDSQEDADEDDAANIKPEPEQDEGLLDFDADHFAEEMLAEADQGRFDRPDEPVDGQKHRHRPKVEPNFVDEISLHDADPSGEEELVAAAPLYGPGRPAPTEGELAEIVSSISSGEEAETNFHQSALLHLPEDDLSTLKLAALTEDRMNMSKSEQDAMYDAQETWSLSSLHSDDRPQTPPVGQVREHWERVRDLNAGAQMQHVRNLLMLRAQLRRQLRELEKKEAAEAMSAYDKKSASWLRQFERQPSVSRWKSVVCQSGLRVPAVHAHWSSGSESERDLVAESADRLLPRGGLRPRELFPTVHEVRHRDIALRRLVSAAREEIALRGHELAQEDREKLLFEIAQQLHAKHQAATGQSGLGAAGLSGVGSAAGGNTNYMAAAGASGGFAMRHPVDEPAMHQDVLLTHHAPPSWKTAAPDAGKAIGTDGLEQALRKLEAEQRDAPVPVPQTSEVGSQPLSFRSQDSAPRAGRHKIKIKYLPEPPGPPPDLSSIFHQFDLVQKVPKTYPEDEAADLLDLSDDGPSTSDEEADPGTIHDHPGKYKAWNAATAEDVRGNAALAVKGAMNPVAKKDMHLRGMFGFQTGARGDEKLVLDQQKQAHANAWDWHAQAEEPKIKKGQLLSQQSPAARQTGRTRPGLQSSNFGGPPSKHGDNFAGEVLSDSVELPDDLHPDVTVRTVASYTTTRTTQTRILGEGETAPAGPREIPPGHARPSGAGGSLEKYHSAAGAKVPRLLEALAEMENARRTRPHQDSVYVDACRHRVFAHSSSEIGHAAWEKVRRYVGRNPRGVLKNLKRAAERSAVEREQERQIEQARTILHVGQ
ncbi:unnamed protein product [Amoebophrya sp. A120]|nr:unnamed protein product [Amoebophrya sp. A120]|eukprot:GSA120T00002215001.1